MNERRKELKQKARRALTGRYFTASASVAVSWGFTVLLFIMAQMCLLFSGILSLFSGNGGKSGFTVLAVFGFCTAAFFLFRFLLLPGMAGLYLAICRGRETGVGEIFRGFHDHTGKFLGIGILAVILAAVLTAPVTALTAAAKITGDREFASIFLPCYYLLLTGVWLYVRLTYGQFYMILADNPEKSILRALEESREMMTGSRLKFLGLRLSFLGWIPVVLLTMGVSLLWLIPYVSCSQGFFYLGAKARWSLNQEFCNKT